MEKFVCIHGHFYQPPRENAWLEAVEVQDSAFPYHDWNDRITAECYATNATTRLLDEKGLIRGIVNNYAQISFNFGPTLLSWLEQHAPAVYQSILEADRQSQERFSGHGSALAQAYNHMIMPLAHRRDKYTQILWGIRDFKHRFGRPPEGMWLPETAVDLETLDIMTEQGIRFTILSPRQAARVRPPNRKQWTGVVDGKIDPTRAYRLQLPSGRHVAIFFYDGPISHAVAFENLLHNGEAFARRLTDGFDSDRQQPQLVHIATDGETYGHHQRHGDMALAYALDTIEANGWAKLTNYGQFLEKYPPRYEVMIHEHSSWSCPHGVERWRSDCGCRTGRFPHWHQAWRGPLRAALDWLRDLLAPIFETEAGRYLKHPWQARDDYIHILLDRSEPALQSFFRRHAKTTLFNSDRSRLIKLLEMQRHSMLMYTSCGWFFDDPSGIETVQIMQYAGRVIQLAAEIGSEDPEPSFLAQLARARSNIPMFGDGRRLYQRFVLPAMVDLQKVAAHYAVTSLFEPYPEQGPVFCYSAQRRDYQYAEAGKAKLAVGRVAITSRISAESNEFYFGLLHLGDHNIVCGCSSSYEADRYQRLWTAMLRLFRSADFPKILKVLDDHFGGVPYSIKSLFKDQQRRVVDLIMAATVRDFVSVYRHMYAPNVPLMRFLKDSGSPAPKALSAAAELVLNFDLHQEFERDPLDFETIHFLLDEADLIGIALDTEDLEFNFRRNLEQRAESFGQHPEQEELLENLIAVVEFAEALPFDVNLRKIQDICFHLIGGIYQSFCRKDKEGHLPSGRWVRRFRQLAEKLHIQID